MPSEQQLQQTRPALGDRRSTDSVTVRQDNSPPASTLSSPPTTSHAQQHQQQHGKSSRAQKHVVHGARAHTRVPSNKALHKLSSKAATTLHGGIEGSHADLKKVGKNNSSSTTNLKKNSSHVSLRRNRSSADVPQKRPKSSEGGKKRPTSVHFEIGDQEQDDAAWEEASSSTSPALSRAASRSGQSSSKPSASNSQVVSPLAQSPVAKKQSTNGGAARPANSNTDAKVITEKLLNRVPSLSSTTTKMSLATATPAGSEPSEDPKDPDLISRFVGSSAGTPSENSPFLQSAHRHSQLETPKDEPKRAQSMGNLTRPNTNGNEDISSQSNSNSSRKSSSTTQHPYNPPQQSRTQQKLWLQRASSNIEPANPGMGMNAALYDGRDPRIKSQLERTGLEYLVVRRYQDPVGAAVKRVEKLPGAEKYRRIPPSSSHQGANGKRSGTAAAVGLSSYTNSIAGKTKTLRGSYEEQSVGSAESNGVRGEDDNGVNAVLRSMWEKSYDLSASQD